MRRSFTKPLRQCKRSNCRTPMHVTCPPQLVQSWESYTYLLQKLHSVVTVLCHINLVVKLNGVIIRFVGIACYFE